MTTIALSLAALAECLCQQIKDTPGVPCVSFCGVVPGEIASAEYVECGCECEGMAWVRLSNAYPSVEVGVQDVTVGNCSKGLGVDVEIGIMRCMSVGGGADGTDPVDPADLLAAAIIQQTDIEVMHRALRCCDSISPKDFVVGPYTPLGPQGGLVGGFVTISLAIF